MLKTLIGVSIALMIHSAFGSSVDSKQTTLPFFSPNLPKRCPSPPCVCNVDDQERKVVTCTSFIQTIPIDKMDPETHMINITSERYNALTLGPIFTNMTYLEELHITRSKLPAIGESTFCPLQCIRPCQSPLRTLDLSQNNIDSLVQKNFNCLDFLEVLNLEDNNLSVHLPSAPFIKLKMLRKLFLARNRFNKLVPLMFHSLDTLEELDLSENPLSEINSNDLKNLPKLRVLNLNGCQLTRLNGFTFSELTSLEYLDLRDNHLKHLNKSSFVGLENLRTLLLNRNSLTVLPDNVFADLYLNHLDLSKNLINPLTNCVFCGVDSIKKLDLSNNKITSFSSGSFEPLGNSLEELSIDRNHHLIDAPSSLVALLQPLRRLKRLNAAEIGLESLPESTFDTSDSIIFLNISNNKLAELNSRLLNPLIMLDTLDVSNNKLSFIDPSTFQVFRNMRFLSRTYLHGNPFSCYRCHILPMIDWLNSDPSEYWSVCKKLTNDPKGLINCARCSTPSSLEGRYLHEPMLNHELEWCINPEVQLRLTASEPRVGLILAFLIILSLVALILVVVAIYRKHGAVYYTQEDKLTSKEEIYAASVGAPTLHWASNHQNQGNRMVSLTSTNYTTSRQNTIVSPQSSTEQQTTPNFASANNIVNTTSSSINSAKCTDICGVGCTECANTTAVKQVIASIPAMTEMLENSLQKIQQKQKHSNGNVTKNNGTSVVRPQPPPVPVKKSSLTNKEINKIEENHLQLPPEAMLLPPIKIEENDDQYQVIDSPMGETKDVQIYI